MKPRHVTCVLGRWSSFAPVEALVAKLGGKGFALDREYSQLAPDERMPRAFAVSADRVDFSLTAKDEAAIAKHSAVAYILGPPMTAPASQQVSARLLRLIAALLEAGALAVKCESAGIAHGAKRWRELAKRGASRGRLERATALRLAFVRRPIEADGLWYSCGMHLLGERDVEVACTDDVHAEIGWIDLLATYLLAEKARGVRAGEGFRQSADGERRILRASPCTRYAADDFHHNPYGYWRLEA